MDTYESQIKPASGRRFLSVILTLVCFAGSAILGSIASTTATLILLAATSLGSGSALAQSTTGQAGTDIIAPIIELEEIDSGVAGQDQVFTALVADNGSLLDVKLYFRYAGQQAFQNVPMEALSNTSFYLATIKTPADEIRAIEYYVQARDAAGNRAVEGFAFEPLVRELTPPENDSAGNQAPASETANQPPQTQGESSSGGIKVWQIVLGLSLIHI